MLLYTYAIWHIEADVKKESQQAGNVQHGLGQRRNKTLKRLGVPPWFGNTQLGSADKPT